MGLYCKPAWWKAEFPSATREMGMMIVLEYLTQHFLLAGLLVSSDSKISRFFKFSAAFWENADLLRELLVFTEPAEESSMQILSLIFGC